MMYMKASPMIRRKTQRKKAETSRLAEVTQPFIEHLYELRKRLIYIVGSIMLFSSLAYLVQQHIVSFLLNPSHHQQFIYTSPGGGINFLFTVCIYVGVAASMPIIVYQILAFLRPLIEDHVRRSVIYSSFYSALLAVVGFGFGYYIGLPAALHFLSHQFVTGQIHPLFTLQEYMSFLTIYLLGSMLLFQLPIVLIFINRIRPLRPRKLFKAERYVIVAAFIISMLMAPTANIFDQLIIAGPIIFMYNFTILLLWMINKRKTQQELLTEKQKMFAANIPKKKLIPIGSFNNNFNVAKPLHKSKPLINDIMPSSLKTSTNLSHSQK